VLSEGPRRRVRFTGAQAESSTAIISIERMKGVRYGAAQVMAFARADGGAICALPSRAQPIVLIYGRRHPVAAFLRLWPLPPSHMADKHLNL